MTDKQRDMIDELFANIESDMTPDEYEQLMDILDHRFYEHLTPEDIGFLKVHGYYKYYSNFLKILYKK